MTTTEDTPEARFTLSGDWPAAFIGDDWLDLIEVMRGELSLVRGWVDADWNDDGGRTYHYHPDTGCPFTRGGYVLDRNWIEVDPSALVAVTVEVEADVASRIVTTEVGRWPSAVVRSSGFAGLFRLSFGRHRQSRCRDCGRWVFDPDQPSPYLTPSHRNPDGTLCAGGGTVIADDRRLTIPRLRDALHASAVATFRADLSMVFARKGNAAFRQKDAAAEAIRSAVRDGIDVEAIRLDVEAREAAEQEAIEAKRRERSAKQKAARARRLAQQSEA